MNEANMKTTLQKESMISNLPANVNNTYEIKVLQTMQFLEGRPRETGDDQQKGLCKKKQKRNGRGYVTT